MENLQEKIEAILRNRAIDADDEGPSRAEEIEKLIDDSSWSSVQDYLFVVLKDDSRTVDEWEVVGAVFWGAVLDKREVAANQAIALLYHRLPLDPDSAESNLAWSIASKLKGVDYHSEYNPLDDPDVQRYLPKADGA